ncbi:hypothetical protein [Mycoplasma sp. Mirounga ES2805-ORL]|uniref:hypothetical protein n=1 Tax=Mycoplasma sp. Mirounga ES2805-ORL TaxID=754514 RepID=UPI00197C9006|nr:hypothetical protein [Mycoplasma sp. Mirounga ES2805-ORL]QSF13452.1 hypothetical protein JXZ90_02125 [Mycoplasma sp. Mirounga ES2805-ORL]
MILKNKIIISGSVLGGASIVGGVTAGSIIGYRMNNHKNSDSEFSLKQFNKNKKYPSKKYNFEVEEANGSIAELKDSDLITNNRNVVDLVDFADINLFGISTSVQPFWDQLRLAMMCKGEVHFSQFVGNGIMSVDKDLFEKWLNNNRKENKDIDKKSCVYNYDRDFQDKRTIIKDFQKIIEQNPNKKINLWISSCELNYIRPYVELAGFNNVKLLCLNEANSIISSYESNFKKDIDEYLNNKAEFKFSDIKSGPTGWIPLSTMLTNVYFFFEETQGSKDFKNQGLKRIYTYSTNKDWKIKNDFFLVRDKDNKRIPFTENYFKITGQDWRVERDKVYSNQEKHGKKPKIIFLGGNHPEAEKNSLAHLISKYQDEYNIYYKGHPNFSIIDNWIENVVNEHQEIKYIDNIETTSLSNPVGKKVILKKDNIVCILNNQIQSEELTTNHSKDMKPLWFEKWATQDYHTGALNVIASKEGLNTKNDLIYTGIPILDPVDKKTVIGWRAASPKTEIDTSINNNLWDQYVAPYLAKLGE